MDREQAKSFFMKMIKTPQKEKLSMIDTGVFNEIIESYVIATLESMNISAPEMIQQAKFKLKNIFDFYSAEDVINKKYLNSVINERIKPFIIIDPVENIYWLNKDDAREYYSQALNNCYKPDEYSSYLNVLKFLEMEDDKYLIYDSINEELYSVKNSYPLDSIPESKDDKLKIATNSKNETILMLLSFESDRDILKQLALNENTPYYIRFAFSKNQIDEELSSIAKDSIEEQINEVLEIE